MTRSSSVSSGCMNVRWKLRFELFDAMRGRGEGAREVGVNGRENETVQLSAQVEVSAQVKWGNENTGLARIIKKSTPGAFR